MKKYIFIGGLLILIFFLLINLKSKGDIIISNDNLINEERRGIILPDSLTYNNLSEYEKSIISTFFEKNPEYVEYYKVYGEGYRSVLKDSIKLRYYDKENVIFYISNEKGGYIVNVYDRISWKRKDTGSLSVYSQDVKSKEYLVVVYENKVFYFKVGMSDFEFLKDSELLSDKESYVGSVGPAGPSYELSFDSNTNILTVSVFKTTNPDNGLYQKLREMQFVLN